MKRKDYLTMSQLDRIEYTLDYNELLRSRYKLSGLVWDLYLFMSLAMFVMIGLVSYYALTGKVSPEIMEAMNILIMLYKPYLFFLAGLYIFYIIWTFYQLKKLDKTFKDRVKGGDKDNANIREKAKKGRETTKKDVRKRRKIKYW